MNARMRRFFRDERGQSLALMAVMVAGVTSMLALAIDLGMLQTARREAQRAADASALAGAQEFLRITPASAAVGPAYDSAMAYATRNTVRNVALDTSEVTIQVLPALQKVWVRIERQNISLWFARLFGRTAGTVNAAAAAAAMPASAASCVAPFAVPDVWHDQNEDTDADRYWDIGEPWTYANDPSDYYTRYSGSPGPFIPPETGYGSPYRNGNGMGITDDYGLPLRLKVQDPSQAPVEGFFYPFRIGDNTGANDYRNSIINCDPQVVPLNVPQPLEMGNMVGPTRQGVNALVALDPAAYWDNTTNTVVNSSYGAGWMLSPRVKLVPLYDPNLIAQIVGGNHNVTFNNFALMFVEGMVSQGRNDYVIGRFLYFATGLGGNRGGGPPGTLVRVLQLVE